MIFQRIREPRFIERDIYWKVTILSIIYFSSTPILLKALFDRSQCITHITFKEKLPYWNYPSTLFVLFDTSSVSSWTFAISSICEVGRRPWLLPLKLLLLDVFVFDSPIYKRGVASESVAGLSQLEGTTILTGFVDELNLLQFREVGVLEKVVD